MGGCTGNRKHNRHKIDRSRGNGETKELICTTHGHELRGGTVGRWGCAGRRGMKGRKHMGQL